MLGSQGMLLLWCLPAGLLNAQTTQALISGRIVDAQTGLAVRARILHSNLSTNASSTAASDEAGYYSLPLLTPGPCRIRVTSDNYQPQELHALDLPVAGRLELDFRLSPLTDVWQAGQYRSVFFPDSEAVLTFFGPDVDTSRYGSFEGNRGRKGSLETTISTVIDPDQVRHLPLAGRDIYTMLVTQPGATADSTTARGLGLSINGQRPSASNFLLDGLENNNYLVTGPLMAIAPEAVQEYRVSTNNFSAEYGRTSGFLANAVTRAGGPAWHGLGYFYLKNDVLNANAFQDNFRGLERRPMREHQFGFQAGGPLRPNSLFSSTSFEQLRNRSFSAAQDWLLPSTNFADFTLPGSAASRLLSRFPAPPVTDRNLPYATLTLAPPVSLDRTLFLQRFDFAPQGSRNHLMARFAATSLSRPDFIWTPYRDFVSGLSEDTRGVAISFSTNLRPGLALETRAGWSSDDLHWDRPHPEIPTLTSTDGTTLPGSPAAYAYLNRGSAAEFVENLTLSRGRHVFKAGTGLLLRRLDGFLTAGRDGLYGFSDIIEFALDSPSDFTVSVARAGLPALASPDYTREYRYNQYFLFAQDAFRLTGRLVLNYGARYENFGAPRRRGPSLDGIVALSAAPTFAASIAGARLDFADMEGRQLYEADNNNVAGRIGFSYDLTGNAGTVLRGSYGIFYDRPFDNLWQNLRNNNYVLTVFPLSEQVDFLRPVSESLAALGGQPFNQDFPQLTMFQPGLRDAYVQSWFFGVQRQIGENLAVEVNGLGSLGRKLITTDLVNRALSRSIDLSNPDGRLNPDLPPVNYRANQGTSNYNALTAVARYRTRRAQFQVAYTWSHSIDNQSEPLAGDFFDLRFTRAAAAPTPGYFSAFARQFDSGIDRSNSDFDQRHNLVAISTWELPGSGRVFGGWWLSQLAAFRTGFPYSVLVPSRFVPGGELIANNRADAVGVVVNRREATDGGERLLDRSALREPPPGRLGNTGRNAFRAPGLFSVDLSLARTIALPWIGESGRLTLRADAYNVLNHANLGNPVSELNADDFGVALYGGRRGRESSFPALMPLVETPRQIQLILRLEF